MTTPPTPFSFARLLQDFRAYVGWTQQDLADAIPTSWRSVSRWETGHTRRPRPIYVRRIRQIMRDKNYPPQAS